MEFYGWGVAWREFMEGVWYGGSFWDGCGMEFMEGVWHGGKWKGVVGELIFRAAPLP